MADEKAYLHNLTGAISWFFSTPYPDGGEPDVIRLRIKSKCPYDAPVNAIPAETVSSGDCRPDVVVELFDDIFVGHTRRRGSKPADFDWKLKRHQCASEAHQWNFTQPIKLAPGDAAPDIEFTSARKISDAPQPVAHAQVLVLYQRIGQGSKKL